MASKKELAQITVQANRWWEAARGARKELDWKWFVYDLWVTGNHYAKWDRNTQQIVTTPKDKGKPKVVINKTYSTLRAVRNYALKNRPKAEVTPVDLTEDNLEEAKKLNKYLDFLHEKLKLRTKLKASVWHALKYSVGFWQVLWDEDSEDGKGEVDVHVVDPYDLYWDPVARSPEEARYVILAVRRNVKDLDEDPKYNIKSPISGDKQVAASNVKARLLQSEKGIVSSDKEDETVIVREVWYKKFNKQTKKHRIMICTFAGDEIIREPEDTGLDRFPFFRLQADVEPLQMYGEGWVKNLIPINKLIDRLESQLAEYNDLMNRGKWVADKGAGARVINNENGQIIEKKRGFEVKQEAIVALSAAIYTQIENANRYMEDIGAAHDATLGRIPAGAKSGRALEALQAGDANNMSEIVENIEEFLENVYEYILSLAAQKYQFARRITPITRSGERDFIEVIGEEASNIPEEATVIPKKNMVDVKITSWLAHTNEVRQEILKELFQVGAIDQQTLLEGYNIGSVADIISRKKFEDREASAQAIAEQQVSQQAGQPQSGKREAIAAIRSLIQGQMPPIPPSPGQEYITYFDQFLSDPNLSEDIRGLVQQFRDQVLQGGQLQAKGV